MRILRFDLTAYGPFTETTLDLSGEAASIHVVHGPNEAGKSTALRALRGLLFGISRATPDAHVHPVNDLRVGALLEGANGALLEIVRRGSAKLLRDRDGASIDPKALESFLGGATEELFERLFGLDHERLRSGAAALLESRGDVGASLFDAGLGGRGITKLLAELEKEHEKVWSPKARTKPELQQALAALKKAEARKKSEGLSVDAWTTAEDERRALAAELERLAAEQRRVRAEQRNLERRVRVAPMAQERAELAAQREALGEIPRLSPEAISRRRALSTRRETLAQSVGRLEAKRAELTRQRDAIDVDERLVALPDDVVGALVERLAGHRRGAADRPAREAELAMLEARLAERVRALGVASLDDALRSRPTPAALARLRALAARRSGIDEAARAARKALARCEARLADTERLLDAKGAAEDPEALERALDEAKREGDLRARLEEVMRTRDARRRELEATLAALVPGDAARDASALGVARPLEETLERLGADEDALRRERARLDEERVELGRRRVEHARKLDLLLAGGEPPSEDDLAAARASRDALLAVLRAGADGRGATGEALAAAVARADTLADRLRAEAGRVAEKKQLDLEARDLDRRGAEVDARHGVLEEREAGVARRRREAAAGFGFEPGTSDELRGFLRRLDDARAIAARLADAEEAALALERAEARHVERLREMLEGSEAAAELRPLVDRAEARLRALRDAASERRRLEEAGLALRAERADAAAAVAEAEDELARFLDEWRDAAAALGLGSGATGEEVDALVELLSGLSADALRAAEIRRELEAGARESEELDRRSADLAVRHAPELAAVELDRRVAELARRHREACALAARRDALSAELGRHAADLAEAAGELSTDDRALAEACAAAGAPDVAALEVLEEGAGRLRVLDDRLATLEASLAREAEGGEVGALLLEVEGLDLEATRDAIAALESRVEALAAEEKAAAERLGGVRAALDQMRDRSVEEAAAEVESEVANVRALALRFARARLAAEVLRREIVRYRASHEGPVLAHARALLPRLTLGRYGDVRVGATDSGALSCVRADGAEIPVEALSDGTRDQLYLALRLAAIAVHAAEETPLPLVLDDVLIHFDDARARAALAVLGELSATTQVLFFTHHERLVALAREAIPDARLRVHALEARVIPAKKGAEASVVEGRQGVLALEGEVGDRR